MDFKLFIGENCHQCDEVVEMLKTLKVEIEIINIDLGGEKPPIAVFAYPALLKGGILLRYGSDIIDYFKK